MHALPIRMASASIQLIVALLHAQHCRIFFLKPNCSLKKNTLHSFLNVVVHLSEKAMATHSSTLAWKIPWMEEPGRLQSMGLLRVGHNWATSISLFTFMHWRRKWQPTSMFLPGESQGWGSLVGCRLWDCTVGHNWSDLAATAAGLSEILSSWWD